MVAVEALVEDWTEKMRSLGVEDAGCQERM